MPPRCKFKREEITAAALAITRSEGVSAVTARAIGAKLGSSSKVIFSLFQNMEEVQQEVIRAASALYQSYLDEDMKSGKYPPYKASGMAYIRFAKEEKELFKLLFMRDRSEEVISSNPEDVKPLIRIIQQNTGMSEQDAFVFHLEMWVFVHGIATMIATGYVEGDWELISKMLTDSYLGTLTRFQPREVE